MSEDFQGFCRRANVEASLILVQEEMEVLVWYSIVSPQMPLRLAPEILDVVDTVSVQNKMPAVVDAFMMEFQDIQFVVCVPGIAVNN